MKGEKAVLQHLIKIAQAVDAHFKFLQSHSADGYRRKHPLLFLQTPKVYGYWRYFSVIGEMSR